MSDKLPLHNKSGLIAWDGTQWVNVSTDSSGNLNMNLVGGSVSISGVDGAITDGVTASVKATVKESSANPGTFGLVVLDSTGADIAGGSGGGSGTEYTEDAASAANPAGPMTMFRRRDTLSATEVSADSDNIAANATAKGELYVKHSDAIASTVADGANVAEGATTDSAVTGDNSGTISAKLRGINKILADVWDSINSRLNVYIQNTSIPVTDNGGTLSIDDGAGSITVDGTFWQATQPVSAASLPLPSGAATAAKQPALGTAGTASADVLAVQGIASMTALKVDGSAVTQPVSIAAAVPVTDNSGSLTVDGTVAATQSGTWNVGTVTTITNVVHVDDNASTLSIDDGGGNISIDDGGNSITVDGTVTAANTAGDVAHDGADSGNPVKIGGKATSSEPTAVASGDRANLITDLVGKLITLPYANPENFVSGAITSSMTGTTSTSLVAAPGAGLRNYITTIIVSNAHATVGTDVVIQDGSSGTTLLTIPAAAVYGGAVINLPVPLRQPTTNTALYCANVTTGASTKVSAVGYKGV